MRDDAGNARWWYRDAMIVSGFGRLEDALPLFRRAAALAPDYVPTWVRIGDAELKLNRPAAAGADYRQALKRDANNAYAWFGLARIDYAAQRWDAAREELEASVRSSDWRVGYDLLPTVYERLGRPEDAAAIRGKTKASGAYQDMPDPWLDELLDDCYDPFRLSVAAGDAYYRGDVDRAISLMQRSLRLADGNGISHYQLGNYYSAQNRFDEAIAEYRRAAELQPGVGDAWEAWAVLLRHQGDLAQAARVLAEGLQHAPGQAGLHLEYGRLLEQQGQLADAAREYEASIRCRQPEEAAPYIALGEVCFKLGRLDDGIKWFREGLRLEPDHPTLLSILSTYEIKTADEPTARTWLMRARNQPRIGAAHIQAIENAYVERFGSLP